MPRVFHYDASRNNELGNEYMLMSMATSRSFEALRKGLPASEHEEYLEGLLGQVVEIILELYSPTWQHIGRLQETLNHKEGQIGGANESRIMLGPVVDETMWQVPELNLFWASQETFESLNTTGPFPSYVSFLTAQAEKCIYAIQRHESLSPMWDLIPWFEDFIVAMNRHKNELNQTQLVLARRDLHVGNITYDVSTRQITTVLDWELGCIVPAQRWDPQRAFWWYGVDGEKIGLKKRVATKCSEKGIRFFDDIEYTGER